jgi:hypothetical protein
MLKKEDLKPGTDVFISTKAFYTDSPEGPKVVGEMRKYLGTVQQLQAYCSSDNTIQIHGWSWDIRDLHYAGEAVEQIKTEPILFDPKGMVL